MHFFILSSNELTADAKIIYWPQFFIAPMMMILDYTDDPSTNLLPGDVNMNKLRGMYLTRRLRRIEQDGTVIERTELVRR